MFDAAAVCSMRSLCVRCRHGVFEAGTLQHLKAWMRSPHDSSCTGRWSVVDCTEGRRQKCVDVSSTTRCKPNHDTARSAPHCRLSSPHISLTIPPSTSAGQTIVEAHRRHRPSPTHALVSAPHINSRCCGAPKVHVHIPVSPSHTQRPQPASFACSLSHCVTLRQYLAINPVRPSASWTSSLYVGVSACCSRRPACSHSKSGRR